MTLLHGHHLEVWKGRIMKSNRDFGRKGSQNRNPVRVVDFTPCGTMAIVHPSGHKQTDTVPVSSLLPFWSRNNDLRTQMSTKIPKLRNLPLDKFIGRRIKAPIPDQGFCPCVLVAFKGEMATVEIKHRGVPKHYEVKVDTLNPNWASNQDLFQEHMALRGAPEGVEVVSVAKAFDAAMDQHPGILIPQPEKAPEPVLASVESIKPKPTPKPRTTPPVTKTHPSIPFLFPTKQVKHLIVGIDAVKGWDSDFEVLQTAIAERADHQEKVTRAMADLAEHDRFIQMCVDALQEKKVGVAWQEEHPAPPATNVKNFSGQVNTPEKSFPPGELLKRLLGRMVPLRTYRQPELAELVEHENNTRFTNILQAALNQTKDIVRVERGVYQLK